MEISAARTQIYIQLAAIAILILLILGLIISRSASPDFYPFYGLKRTQEKVFLSLKFDNESKIDYMSYLLDNRLSELDGVVKEKNYDYVLPAASRYSSLAGEITNILLENSLKDKSEQTKQTFIKHQKILNDLYIMYPKNTDNVEYKYIEDDINYLKLYLEKLATIK